METAMTENRATTLVLIGLGLIALSGCGNHPGNAKSGAAPPVMQATADAAGAKPSDVGSYLPDPGRKYPERVLWGDEHVHTGWSFDAGIAGATLTPEDAVRFGRGEQVTSSSGQQAKLARPMDWIAVTDHSDGMGTIDGVRDGNPEMMADPTVKRWHDMMAKGGDEAIKAKIEVVTAQGQGTAPKVLADPKWMTTAWQQTVDIMEKYNEPGKFTAFISYEWTSNATDGSNLHRNVIFRDNADKTRGLIPLTTMPSADPANLWKWLANYEATSGGKVLAIPHNGNMSNGRMFEEQQYDGKALTKQWVDARARWEPIIELFQYKGQSEAHPSLSPMDEFANFELWDTGNLNGIPKKPGMIEHEYWREALKAGLRLEAKFGTNPFKLGAAAGTDTHNSLSAPIEDNFWGKFATVEPGPERWNGFYKKEGDYVRKDWTQSAAGYTGVWATANTREALWDAMKRRETYASSGPRITVRFFGGYDFTAADADAAKLVQAGYERGVPMGGDLLAAPAGKAPTFLIAAMKDPSGANLDVAQVVKGWVDADGKQHEAIYNVVWSDSDKRKEANGKLPAVGNSVDLSTATYQNSIGAPELISAFTDPAFDPKQRAFYYVRVLEIPTPRWTAYDAVRYKVKMDPEVTMTVIERAITSPIWYSPSGT
jgi:hypothetical protein